MEPQLIEKPEMMLVGIVASASDVSLLNIGELWQRFSKHSDKIKHRIEGKDYELHIQEDTLPAMHFCLIGVQVQQIEDVPIELFAKVIPACRYTVFTHCLKEGGFGSAFKMVYDWLNHTEYKSAYPFDIQCYDARFKGPHDPDSVLEIYVPIVPK